LCPDEHQSLPMPVRKIQPDDLQIRIKWIMLMRVILVTFLFGVTILASFRSGSSEIVSSFTYLYFLIAYSYLLTGLSAFFYKYVKRLSWFSYFQIVVDIFFITGILQITGGVESPFVFLYFLSILSGSLLLYQQGSLIAAIMSALSYMVLVYIKMGGLTSLKVDDAVVYEPSLLYYKIFLNLFSFFIIAFLGNQLAKRLKIAGEQIQQKEESIQDLQIFNENIIQSIKSGLITTDLAGKITSVNRSAEKITRIEKEEILKLYLVQLFPYPEVKQYLESKSLEKGEEASRFEVTFVNRQSEKLILGMTLSLLQNKWWNHTGLICTFQDLTRFKALEEKMRRNEQLAMIGELSAGIAHEIRNPLASMSGSIQVLRSELDLSIENKRLMDIILKETDRLNTLIGNFLMYARPRPLECKPVRIKDLFEETFTLLQNNRQTGESIRMETDIDETIELLVDAMAVRQVFWNLASNAVEAMAEGGILRIQMSNVTKQNSSNGDRGEEVVRISVSDTGPGVAQEIGKTLFFPFHTTKEGGSGLGLAIVHQIMQQHGGWVDVVSHPGEGAVFHLYFPMAVQPVVS
jgi:two-component system sensor histidine kinase PilS (NtrC family)